MSDAPVLPAADSAAAIADTTPSFYDELVALHRTGTAFVAVFLVEALGSTPQDTGAKMLVTAVGRHAGTVGGGRLEAQAIAHAQRFLSTPATFVAPPTTAAPEPPAAPSITPTASTPPASSTSTNSTTPAPPPAPTPARFVSWTLKTDVGMTCGGSVKLYFEPHAAASAAWPIVLFGAGHVAQALVRVLLPLPCDLLVIDSRAEWLDRLPRAPHLRTVRHDSPADLVPTLPARTFLLCLTPGHTTDRPVLQRALAERAFPFVGVIGSAAKAAVLRRELLAAGLSPARAAAFYCPVGLDFGTNHPHEIALSIAAQLLTERDRALPNPPAAAIPAP